MRARARALGWSDAEVARRLDVGQTRYANYVTDRHEPDLETFSRICSVLGVSPSDLLGRPAGGDDGSTQLRERIAAAASAMDGGTLAILAAVADGLIATAGKASQEGRLGRPLPRRRTAVAGEGGPLVEAGPGRRPSG